jgi:tetratricopeptide (TPR) repeat protein
MRQARPVPPLKVFLSYSHQDDELCKQFLEHLSQLEREGLIVPWSDQLLTAGEDWDGSINENLDSTHVIILLVSRGFVASKYCNDVEMDRAMERDQKGEARVVPLILRPCDWKTSRFGRLQALPKRGKPVVDWKTRDHGFLDAVEGLRRLIQQISNPAPAPVRVVEARVRRNPWAWAIGTLLAVALLAGWWSWSKSQRHLKEGTDLLNVGLYAEARAPLQQAKVFNPFSRAAGCGLEAADLDAIRDDRARFEQGLREANSAYPHCAYLKLLAGDQKYRMGDRQGAFAEYQEAAKREPEVAEAYFDMGRILDVEGNAEAALEQYRKAAQLSAGTPRYQNNLADLYFRENDYDKAIEAYGQVAEFPLSALAAAKIYRLQGKLEDAAGREQDAIRWLGEPRVQLAEDPNAWAFETSPTREVRLGPINEKQCYAELELAVTEFLWRGDENATASAVSAGFGKCASRQEEVKAILQWELRRLGSEVPQYTQRSDRFTEKFLAPAKAS